MTTQTDYYDVLGIEQDADHEHIRNAYRKLALKYHPDRNSEDGAAEKMRLINEAYAVLSNPDKRREYDAMRHHFGSAAHDRFRRTYSEQDIFNGSDIHSIFEELSRTFGLRGFEEIFREAYGNEYRMFHFGGRGFSGRGYVYTPGRGGWEGGRQIPKAAGKMIGYFLKKVTGIEIPERGHDVVDTIRLSPEEARSGGPREYMHWWRGTRLRMRIPPGIRDGQKIRLAGMGDEGKGGGERGDLYLVVRVKESFVKEMSHFVKRVIH
ncbi:MAG: DnaJ domain-containing protein [Deltaproteobacteria bacterium]|nr:DnaJ domain-containing protein [Deltaproteobacteria bacterium]